MLSTMWKQVDLDSHGLEDRKVLIFSASLPVDLRNKYNMKRINSITLLTDNMRKVTTSRTGQTYETCSTERYNSLLSIMCPYMRNQMMECQTKRMMNSPRKLIMRLTIPTKTKMVFASSGRKDTVQPESTVVGSLRYMVCSERSQAVQKILNFTPQTRLVKTN